MATVIEPGNGDGAAGAGAAGPPAAAPAAERGQGPRLRTVVALNVAAAAVILLTLAGMVLRQQGEHGPQSYGALPAWSLIESSGQPLTSDDLKGSVYVADFVFTRCAGPCADMSATMARLQRELPPRSDLKLVSFTVDPEHDSPEVLRAYARAYEAQVGRWLFCTGTVEAIERLAQEGFKLPVDRGKDAFKIAHSSKLVLVDAEGNIRGYYAVNEEEPLRALQRDVAAILR